MAETAERTVRGRTSRRQRFVVASVGAGLRRFVPGRGAGPERADVGARIGDFVSGDFRREGMGAPGIGDSPAHLTASRPVPSFRRPYPANLRVFLRSAANRGAHFSGMRYPERNRPGRRCTTTELLPHQISTLSTVGTLPADVVRKPASAALQESAESQVPRPFRTAPGSAPSSRTLPAFGEGTTCSWALAPD